MLPKPPKIGTPLPDDLLNQYLKFNGGMTSDNLRRGLPQHVLQTALTPAQGSKAKAPDQGQQPTGDRPKK